MKYEKFTVHGGSTYIEYKFENGLTGWCFPEDEEAADLEASELSVEGPWNVKLNSRLKPGTIYRDEAPNYQSAGRVIATFP